MSSLETLKNLVEIDSPTGFTEQACEYSAEVLRGYGYEPELSNKGAVRCSMGPAPRLAIAAHTDTLCLLYTSPSPRDGLLSRMPSSA